MRVGNVALCKGISNSIYFAKKKKKDRVGIKNKLVADNKSRNVILATSKP